MNAPGPAHRLLDSFVGRWKTEGVVKATKNKPEIKINGYDIYEWLPGGFFLLHKVDVYFGDDRNETMEIIGFDEKSNSYSMQHYDNKGNSGFMRSNYKMVPGFFQAILCALQVVSVEMERFYRVNGSNLRMVKPGFRLSILDW